MAKTESKSAVVIGKKESSETPSVLDSNELIASAMLLTALSGSKGHLIADIEWFQ